MPRLPRLTAAALVVAAAAPASAQAAPDMLSMMQDDDLLVYRDDRTRDQALDKMKRLGVDRVRVTVLWRVVGQGTTRRSRNLDKPSGYRAKVWNRYDNLVRAANQRGIGVYFSVTGPGPSWAHGKAPKGTRPVIAQAWRPKHREFYKFVKALGTRYSGRYRDEDTGRSVLPRVDVWGLWNEPNQAGWLAPQWATNPRTGKPIATAPIFYRRLYLLGRRALQDSGHGRDDILIGETAPLGSSKREFNSPMRPKPFFRELLCVRKDGSRYTGASARDRDCGLFDKLGALRATGVGHHPYTKDLPPTERDRSPDSISIANLGDLTKLTDSLARKTGDISPRLDLWSTEFGYETNPPDRFSGQPMARVPEYLNVGDFLAYRNPRVVANTQFLLNDVPPVAGISTSRKAAFFTYQSGLNFADGKAKPLAAAWALPIHPRRAGANLALWGQLRFLFPRGTASQVALERKGPGEAEFAAVGAPIPVQNKMNFFSARIPFPGPGLYRVRWSNPQNPFIVAFSREAEVK